MFIFQIAYNLIHGNFQPLAIKLLSTTKKSVLTILSMAIEYLVKVIVVILEDHAHWAVVVPLGLDNTGKSAAIHPPHKALLPPQQGVVQHHVPGDIQGGWVP